MARPNSKLKDDVLQDGNRLFNERYIDRIYDEPETLIWLIKKEKEKDRSETIKQILLSLITPQAPRETNNEFAKRCNSLERVLGELVLKEKNEIAIDREIIAGVIHNPTALKILLSGLNKNTVAEFVNDRLKSNDRSTQWMTTIRAYTKAKNEYIKLKEHDVVDKTYCASLNVMKDILGKDQPTEKSDLERVNRSLADISTDLQSEKNVTGIDGLSDVLSGENNVNSLEWFLFQKNGIELAYSTPEKLTNIVAKFPAEHRYAVTQEILSRLIAAPGHRETPEQCQERYSALAIFLNNIPDNKLADVLYPPYSMDKDTILEKTLRNSDALKIVLERIPEDDRIRALNDRLLFSGKIADRVSRYADSRNLIHKIYADRVVKLEEMLANDSKPKLTVELTRVKSKISTLDQLSQRYTGRSTLNSPSPRKNSSDDSDIQLHLKRIRDRFQQAISALKRFHLFNASGESLRGTDYSALQGDALKDKILQDFKAYLDNIDDEKTLNAAIQGIKRSEAYRILATGQGIVTRVMKRETSSVAAFEKMEEAARARVRSNSGPKLTG